jgi:hypothetical protein
LLSIHEAQDEGGPHYHISAKADHCHQDVGEEHALGLLPEAGRFCAQEDKGDKKNFYIRKKAIFDFSMPLAKKMFPRNPT